MKIRKLEICGFKSFVDRTVLTFDRDIVGIVGPNGCGKSNVVDAIRWAMGEQSARHLRGKSMEDVIFNGSESRPPHGFAEVTITFDNTDGLAPVEYRDYAELAITRRLHRNGDSEYLINKTQVRLLDVTQLFLGTGVGTKAYSIIEQGRIGLIVSSKPEDRRALIEEAAGITKFKMKKKAAERKMEQTRLNLDRVGDIIREIEGSLASLKRQAQKAERYKQLRSELREHELHVAVHRWLELDATHKFTRQALQDAQHLRQEKQSSVSAQETELEAERLVLQQQESVVEQTQLKAFEADNIVRVVEGQIQQGQERMRGLSELVSVAEREIAALTIQRQTLTQETEVLQGSLVVLQADVGKEDAALGQETEILSAQRKSSDEAEAELSKKRAELADVRTRLARMEANLSGFERRQKESLLRLERLRTDMSELETRRSELTHALESLRQAKTQSVSVREDFVRTREQRQEALQQTRIKLQETEKRVEQVRGELVQKRSRLRSLEELQARFEGAAPGVRALMRDYTNSPETRTSKGLGDLLIDRINCPQEWTEALVASLGDGVQAVIAQDAVSALNAARYLTEKRSGRAVLLPKQSSVHPRTANGSALPTQDTQGVLGRLCDFLSFDSDDAHVVLMLLGHVWVVESLGIALALQTQYPLLSWVTPQGEWLGERGDIAGGKADAGAAHLVDVRRESSLLRPQVEALDTALAEAVSALEALRQQLHTLQSDLDTARNQAHASEIESVRVEKDLKRAEDDLAQAQSRLERVTREFAELSQSEDQTGDEVSRLVSELDILRISQTQISEVLSSLEAISRDKRAQVEQQSQKVTEVRVRAVRAKQQAESHQLTLERLTRSREELTQRDVRLQKDIADGQAQTAQLETSTKDLSFQLTEHVQTATAMQERLKQERSVFEELRGALFGKESAIKSLRSALDAAASHENLLAMKHRELDLALEHLISQVTERYRVDVRQVIDFYHTLALPDDKVLGRIDELTRVIANMGEINLTAIEEYEEKSGRHAYLTAQRDDLNQALAQLDKAIRQMNQESRRLFKDTFYAVNERFKVIFSTLFRGGKAELRLTDADDMLETGIDIIAMPPGKRLGSIDLMSGGEKALTAVSLIFALFQYRPSPFCLLDEVDAPLDEANIARFGEAIRQMTDHSQFILITHSKRTMELADVLYGVTMETPGVSKLVSVELRPREAGADTKRPKPEDEHAVA